MFKLKYKASPPSSISQTPQCFHTRGGLPANPFVLPVHVPYCMCQIGRPPLFRMEESPSVLLWGMVVKSAVSDFSAVVPLVQQCQGVDVIGSTFPRSFLVPFRIDQKKPTLPQYATHCGRTSAGYGIRQRKKMFTLRKAPSYAAGHCWGLKSVMTETYVVLEHKASCGTLPTSFSPVYMYSLYCLVQVVQVLRQTME